MNKDRHELYEIERGNCVENTKSALAGLVVGSLLGAGAMLLFARSGKKIRTPIQQKTVEL